jgi:putative membrane protein
MIEYELTGWAKASLSYKKTVLPNVIYRLWVLFALTIIILLARDGYLGVSPELIEGLWLPALGHTLIGTALGFVLVFRNNASYDRWWEGRK